jgi:hypothetical protein
MSLPTIRFLPGARVALAALLGLAAALLVGCSGSSAKLIPVAQAGPLQNDFETVAQAAEAGNGSCSATEAAITKTEQNFTALPSSVDAGLRNTLRNGIENLRAHALALCAQPLVQTSATTTTAKTAPTIVIAPSETQTTTTPTTPTSTAPVTPTTTPTTPTNTPEGGTPAPGAGESAPGQAGGGSGEGPAGENGSAGGVQEPAR